MVHMHHGNARSGCARHSPRPKIAAFHPDETEIVSIPLETNVISTVPIAILRSTTSPQLAADFVEFITSDAGRSVFAKHGYTVSLPPGRRAKDGRGYRP